MCFTLGTTGLRGGTQGLGLYGANNGESNGKEDGDDVETGVIMVVLCPEGSQYVLE